MVWYIWEGAASFSPFCASFQRSFYNNATTLRFAMAHGRSVHRWFVHPTDYTPINKLITCMVHIPCIEGSFPCYCIVGSRHISNVSSLKEWSQQFSVLPSMNVIYRITALFRLPQNSKFFHSLSITLIFGRIHGALNVDKK